VWCSCFAWDRIRHAGDIANFAIAYEMQERNSPGSVRGELLVFIEVVAAGNVES
jgi:hypothetical protein